MKRSNGASALMTDDSRLRVPSGATAYRFQLTGSRRGTSFAVTNMYDAIVVDACKVKRSVDTPAVTKLASNHLADAASVKDGRDMICSVVS